MDRYCHNVSGCFAQRTPAENTLSQLIRRGLHDEDLQIYTGDGNAPPTPNPAGRSNGVLKGMLINSLIGIGIGMGFGALVEVVLVISNTRLFSASPLLALLMLLGGGTLLGGFLGNVIGTSKGTNEHAGRCAELLSDAVAHGDVVLVAKTHSAQETALAREVIKASSSLCKDTDMLASARTAPMQ